MRDELKEIYNLSLNKLDYLEASGELRSSFLTSLANTLVESITSKSLENNSEEYDINESESIYKSLYRKIQAKRVGDLTSVEQTYYETLKIFNVQITRFGFSKALDNIQATKFFSSDELDLIVKYTKLIFNPKLSENSETPISGMSSKSAYNPHITAKARSTISTPLKYILSNVITLDDLKTHNRRVLDYGCGRGFDVEYLQSEGINAVGYDKYASNPIYLKRPTGKFDVVYSCYVFNVIRSLAEHEETLRTLLSYSKDITAIALRNDIASHGASWTYDEVNDTYNTGRSYQRLYTPESLKKYFPGFKTVKTTNSFILLIKE